MKKPNKIGKLLLSILTCLLAGAIGSMATVNAIPSWYNTIVKPDFNPPNWIFAPVWTILYILMGIAFYYIWTNSKKNKFARAAAILFLIHLVFNALWSVVFFGMHNPLLGLFVIGVLWFMIVAIIFMFDRIKRTAALLLIPYLLWVSFATILNYAIVILN
jgi:tryptophan-rich sensory protein